VHPETSVVALLKEFMGFVMKHGELPSKAAVLFLPTKTSRAFADQYLYWEIKT
jgi:hypothetical protein